MQHFISHFVAHFKMIATDFNQIPVSIFNPIQTETSIFLRQNKFSGFAFHAILSIHDGSPLGEVRMSCVQLHMCWCFSLIFFFVRNESISSGSLQLKACIKSNGITHESHLDLSADCTCIFDTLHII